MCKKIIKNIVAMRAKSEQDDSLILKWFKTKEGAEPCRGLREKAASPREKEGGGLSVFCFRSVISSALLTN
jgi:hypothetical protein